MKMEMMIIFLKQAGLEPLCLHGIDGVGDGRHREGISDMDWMGDTDGAWGV